MTKTTTGTTKTNAGDSMRIGTGEIAMMKKSKNFKDVLSIVTLVRRTFPGASLIRIVESD